jgi:hypothetical protein
MRRSRLRSAPRGEDDAELGSGPTVVLANDSRNSPCGWLEFARGLAGSGHRVVVFAYTDVSAAAEPKSVNEALRVAGAHRYVLIGASLGGRQLHGAMGGDLMLVRGPAHGIVLLDDPAVVGRISAFLRRESR